MKTITFLLLLLLLVTEINANDDIEQWRGPNRNGVYAETGLLNSWPENGPQMLWQADNLGNGYSSVTVKGNKIYITGKEDSVEYLTALDIVGQQLWQIPYGLACRQSYAETRCTPTIEGSRAYLISGRGEVVCVDLEKGEIVWKVPAYEEFTGAYALWEIAESPLLVDNMIIYTPGGDLTTMVALNKNTGETVWQTESLHDSTAYVSPILIERGGKKIIANITRNYLLGVNAASGEILWSHKYSQDDPPTAHPEAPFINCVTPIYHDGNLFITSGYDHTGIMFDLSEDGNAISIAWKQPVLDTHHGGVLYYDGYIYGSNWINNSQGNWVCLDWKTGEVKYEEKWETKGSIIAADGKLFIYEERRGHVGMLNASPDKFEVLSSFRHESGTGPHWAHPVIKNGILYMRHGKTLVAYQVGK